MNNSSRTPGLPSALARSAQIIVTLLRHASTAIAAHLFRTGALSGPRRLRCAIDDLGGTFIKCGQVLSARSDILPPNYRHGLASLRDCATPVPLSAVVAEIEASYGLPLKAVFASFSPDPIASASISQVHAAVLHDGRRVAVKVRRPGIDRVVEADLMLLGAFVWTANLLFRAARDCDVVGMVGAVRKMARGELDLLMEAASTADICQLFGSDPTVVVPRVVETLTISNILVMDFIDGVPLHPDALDAAGLDRSVLAAAVIRTNLTMILEHKTFQADPHAGNYLAVRDGRLALLDFGATGTTEASTRTALDELITALARRDHHGLSDGLLRVTTARGPVDHQSLVRDLDAVLVPLTAATFATLDMGNILRELVNLLRRHHLRLEADMALVLKAIIECESTAQELDPDISFNSVLIPFLLARSLRSGSRATPSVTSALTPSMDIITITIGTACDAA